MKTLFAFLIFASLFCNAQPTIQQEIFGKTNIIHIGKHGYIEKDKTLHFTAGGLIGSSVYMYVHYKTDNVMLSLLSSVASGIIVGVSKEFYDKSRGGVISNDDIAFTISGSFGGAITKIIQINMQQENKMMSKAYKEEFENLGTPTPINKNDL